MSTAALERVPLSELLAVTERGSKTNGRALRLVDHLADQEPVLPFDAWRGGEHQGTMWIPIVVTGLMERTAAFHAVGDRYDTGVLRLDLVFVDPAAVQWQAKVVAKDIKRRWNGAQAPDPKGSIAKSDARALADQARKREEAEREESLRRASVGSVPEGKARAIPAESKPPVLTLGSGTGPTVDDALVNLVKNLIAERNALRAQVDAIEAALVHA